MPRYLLPLLAVAALHAGVMDFRTLSEAKAAYEKGDYTKASEYYGELGDKNDAARYNYADALYQQKKYKEAAEVFSQITSPALKQKALHNLGNSLARSGKTDDALKAYEAALKLGEDKDTRYNLELLKKQQQQQNQQNRKNDQNQKDQDQNNDQQNGQNGQDKDHPQQSGQKEHNPQNRDEENNQNREGQAQSQPEQAREAQKQQSQNASEAEKQPDESAEEKERKAQNAAQAQTAVAQPISDMEERKYNKMLDKRGVQTLMIPLSGKGEPHADETTPW